MIHKLKRTPAIYLVGFMGCGKTTVGRLLARQLGWLFADLDEDIEALVGLKIREIFAQHGEQEFRRIEHEALRQRILRIQKGEATVLALGGGAFAQPANYELVSENGISIWLDCPLEVLRVRVAGDPERPLAQDPVRFAHLYEERRQAYARADFRVDAGNRAPEQIVSEILQLPIFQSGGLGWSGNSGARL